MIGNSRGLTIVELLIGGAVALILTAAVFYFFSRIVGTTGSMQEKANAEQSLHIMMDRLKRDWTTRLNPSPGHPDPLGNMVEVELGDPNYNPFDFFDLPTALIPSDAGPFRNPGPTTCPVNVDNVGCQGMDIRQRIVPLDTAQKLAGGVTAPTVIKKLVWGTSCTQGGAAAGGALAPADWAKIPSMHPLLACGNGMRPAVTRTAFADSIGNPARSRTEAFAAPPVAANVISVSSVAGSALCFRRLPDCSDPTLAKTDEIVAEGAVLYLSGSKWDVVRDHFRLSIRNRSGGVEILPPH